MRSGICLAAVATMACLGLPQETRVAATAPTFRDYPVEHVYKGKVALPPFNRPASFPVERCIGANKEERALFLGDKKPNFAGKYVVDACTCGTGCHFLFMWDAETGKMFRDFPFGEIEIGPFLESNPKIEYSGEHYQVNSTLLIVEGCFDTDSHPDRLDCARYYYNWTGSHFVRVYKERTRVPPRRNPNH